MNKKTCATKLLRACNTVFMVVTHGFVETLSHFVIRCRFNCEKKKLHAYTEGKHLLCMFYFGFF